MNPLLITGSIFVAGEGREALGLAQTDTVWEELNSGSIQHDLPLAQSQNQGN
jgi:hypothetical protein